MTLCRIESFLGKMHLPAFLERWQVQMARVGHQAGGGVLHRSSGQRQLLVDVSVITKNDARTGIQRVVRGLLSQLIAEPPTGFVVRTVAATRNQPYQLVAWGMENAVRAQQGAINVAQGDIFLGLDLAAHILPEHYCQLAEWKKRGATLHFMVYDLLPLRHPEWFPSKLVSAFRHWIKFIAMQADGVICISRVVESDLVQWMHERYALSAGILTTRVIPLGSDITSTHPSMGLPEGFGEILLQLQKYKTALMVGTIEPRKGHAEILDAFEQLWQHGENCNLVIAGRPGWNTEALQSRLRSHLELNHRLFWFDDASDEAVQALYRACDGVIAASFAEGFGLSVIEAIAHGKPVLARDLPVFREIGGGAAHYFKNGNAAVLAREISSWLARHPGESAWENDSYCGTWNQAARKLVCCIQI